MINIEMKLSEDRNKVRNWNKVSFGNIFDTKMTLEKKMAKLQGLLKRNHYDPISSTPKMSLRD